jgi:hypothetical protein
MDRYFDFKEFKTTHALVYSQCRINKAIYKDIDTWAGPTAI